MRPSERIQQYRKPLLVGMVLFSCIVGGCLFPIVNCNPENPVETSLVMKTIILLSVFLFYTELGMLQAALFPKGSIPFAAALNLGFVLFSAQLPLVTGNLHSMVDCALIGLALSAFRSESILRDAVVPVPRPPQTQTA